MKKNFNSEKYGNILYEESFWTGRKRITINGKVMKATSKTTFELQNEEEEIKALIIGNLLKGMTLKVDEEKFEVYAKSSWYEYVLAFMGVVLVIVWGNSVELCSIVPVIGGAIGGGISGLLAVLSLMTMKKVNNPLLKVLIGLGMFVGTFLICMLLGVALVSALS